MAHIQTDKVKLWKPSDLAVDKVDPQRMFIENIDMIEDEFVSLLQTRCQKVDDIASLRGIDTSDTTLFTDGLIVNVVSNGIYQFDRSLSTSEGTITPIKPNVGSGMWVLVDMKNVFTQAGSRVNLVSGENTSTLFGKIMKWFADLKSIAFSGSSNDLTDPNAHANIGSSANATQSTINTGIDTKLGGKEPTIAAGTTSQYWKGNKTWSDLATDVRAILLTGLSTVTSTAITAADSILSALGKLQAQINTKETSANKGVANGYASLDSNAKVPLSQINDALLGNVSYQCQWNASTNTPTLTATPTSKGIYYITSVAGTQFSKSFEVGDWIISNGISWDKIDNTDAVSSVAGRTGNVVLNTGDITDPNTYTNIGSSANATQSTINTGIDTKFGTKLDKTGDASNTTNVFTQAGTRANLTTGEKISVSLGKLMKWFADLKTVAFSGSSNDLTDPNAHTNIGSSANATQSTINTKTDTAVASRVLKNYLINGGFDIWQDGTTQTTSGYGSDDMWINENGITTKIHQRQEFVAGQTIVPNNPRYMSETIVTNGAGGYCCKSHKIEDVGKLSGKKVTLSFWVVANANKNISVEFSQNFGSGGSTNVLGIGSTKIPVTNSWQRVTVTVTLPSVSGKTIGNGSFTALTIWFDAASPNFDARTASLGPQSGSFDLANFSLVEGDIAQEWQNEDVGDVLVQCQRYYQSMLLTGFANSGDRLEIYNPNFKIQMRATPALSKMGSAVGIGDGIFFCFNSATSMPATSLACWYGNYSTIYNLFTTTNIFSASNIYKIYVVFDARL